MRSARVGIRAASALALGFALVAARVAGDERVRLVPERAPVWRVSRVFDSLRDGSREPRELRIETVPAGAVLELAYLRDGSQLARAAGVAPLVVVLPSSGRRAAQDRIQVRAERAGFEVREVALALRDASPRLRIELAPSPRRLLAVSLLELGDHAWLEWIGDRPIEARLTRSKRGWRVALANVVLDEDFAERLDGVRGAAIARVDVMVAGSDLLLELTRGRHEDREPRLVRRSEAVRAASHLALEWLPADRGAATRERARAALDALDRELGGTCSDAFESALTEALGLETLARSLAPGVGFTDAFVALAIERLAARSPSGEVALRDGSRVRLDGRIARDRVGSQAAEVRGVLVAVRALAKALAPVGDAPRALHAWLAPELAPQAFATGYSRALAAEANCRARP